MRLFSKAWVLRVLEELGGEADVELLRMLSAGVIPSKYVVEDCYFPELSETGLSCIEKALRELEYEGKIVWKGRRVALSAEALEDLKDALRSQ